MIAVLWFSYVVGMPAALWAIADENMTRPNRLVIAALWPAVLVGGLVLDWVNRPGA